MTEDAIIRRQSPGTLTKGSDGKIDPAEYNADLAAAALVKELVHKWPKPAIDSRKFTIIHGLMQSINHVEGTNETFVDTSRLIELMDRVSEKSVNVEGKLFFSIFAYLMKPKYIIQGMPGSPLEEKKRSIIDIILGRNKEGTAQEPPK